MLNRRGIALRRTARQRRAHTTRPRCLEPLEERLLLYNTVGQPWPTPDISYSYVPDGSNWYGKTSALITAIDDKAPREVWQREVARALQTWANETNLNFHLSPDDGSLGGMQGDIRIAGTPHESGLGYAMVPTPSVRGGDITLNLHYAYAYFGQVDLYSLVRHEAGHSLGLGHTDVPDSAMQAFNGGPIPLSPDDIAGIQSLYGVRIQDVFDETAPNNDLASATPLELESENAVWRADLTSHADVDYYQVTIPAGVTKLTVAVDARELSLLAPKVAVYDGSQKLLATASGEYGSVATVQIAVTPGQTYTLMADGATSDEFGMGAYRLAVQVAGNTSPVSPSDVATNTSSTHGDGNGNSTVPTQDQNALPPPTTTTPIQTTTGTSTTPAESGAGSGHASSIPDLNDTTNTVPLVDTQAGSTGNSSSTSTGITNSAPVSQAGGNAASDSVTAEPAQIQIRITRRSTFASAGTSSVQNSAATGNHSVAATTASSVESTASITPATTTPDTTTTPTATNAVNTRETIATASPNSAQVVVTATVPRDILPETAEAETSSVPDTVPGDTRAVETALAPAGEVIVIRLTRQRNTVTPSDSSSQPTETIPSASQPNTDGQQTVNPPVVTPDNSQPANTSPSLSVTLAGSRPTQDAPPPILPPNPPATTSNARVLLASGTTTPSSGSSTTPVQDPPRDSVPGDTTSERITVQSLSVLTEQSEQTAVTGSLDDRSPQHTALSPLAIRSLLTSADNLARTLASDLQANWADMADSVLATVSSDDLRAFRL